MSRLEDLIQTFCPDGVEYLWLSEIEDKGYITLGRGNVISKQDLASFPGEFPVYSSSAMGVGEFGRYGKYMFDDERISWSVDGGGRFFYRSPHKYSITNVSGWLAVNDKSRIVIKYLFYVLENEWSKKKFDYVKKAHPSVIRKEYCLPLPPTPVQEEIVRILDTFSSVVTELEQKLNAEQAARVRQYEHYRNELLSFSKAQFQLLTVGEVCETITDYVAAGSFADLRNKVAYKSQSDFAQLVRTTDLKNNFRNKGFVYVTESAFKYLWRVNLNEESIILPNIGNCGEVYYVSPENLPHKHNVLGPNAILVRSRKVNNKFLSYLFLTHEFQTQLMKITSPTGQTKFNKTDLKRLVLPIPSREVQEEIVSIIDRFDALVNDLKSGLPAEIALRRKQYEYYRNKLLTFKPIQPPPGRGSAS